MIITKATEALEVRKINVVDQYCNWTYLSIKINNDIYRMVFEFNTAYGMRYIRQWSINGNTLTNVMCKYPELGLITFDCTNGLLGERPFENDSITFEFLLKPMGIPYSSIEKLKHKWAIGKYELINLLKENNIEYEILYDTIY